MPSTVAATSSAGVIDPQQDVERHLGIVDCSGQIIVQTERPRLTEYDQMARDQIKAQQIKNRGE
jgi:hypothetical protein